ncbi:MAG TPA: hypothetical protein VMH92_01305 [Acidocella sp.]|nr:hypothetical protein [Acidocella sp.]
MVLQFHLAVVLIFSKVERYFMIAGHMSFGLMLVAIFDLRIFWRLMPSRGHFNGRAAGRRAAPNAAWPFPHFPTD